MVSGNSGLYSCFSRVLYLQVSKAVLKKWVQLVVDACGDQQQTEMLLAAAAVLKSVTLFLLVNEKLVLGE